jgi:hypothetical protein
MIRFNLTEILNVIGTQSGPVHEALVAPNELTATSMSRLSQIRSLVTVDVDSMDPDVAKWQSENYEKFRDMTSNQAIVYFQAAKDHSLIRKAIELVRDESPGWYQDPTNQDHDLQEAVDVLVRKILPQTSFK